MSADALAGPPELVRGVPLHTRSLTISLKRVREDLWLARGDVIDLRKNGFVPTSYDIQPAGLIHSMSIELDLDPATLRMDAVRVDQPFVAVEPSERTRGECCRDPAPRLIDLAGECLDDAFLGKLSAAFGGPLGCSHLLTLFQLMASAIPYAAREERARAEREGTRHRIGDRFFRRSVFIDGLRDEEGRIDLAVNLSDSITRPLGEDLDTLERVVAFHEVKIAATIERKRLILERLAIRERVREATTLSEIAWIDHDARFAALVGERVIPGLAKRVFATTAGEPALHAVQDAMLMFAPGFIQVMAALMDTWFEQQAAAKARGDGPPAAPEVANLGGNTDSCYMWRANGPITKVNWARDGDG